MTQQRPTDPTGETGRVEPELLELRSRPQPVTRINRRVLIGGAAIVLLFISGIVLMALKPPRLRISNPNELFNVEHRPISDALSRLPASYEGLKRGPGLFIVNGTPAAGRSVADLEAAWRVELRRLIDEGVGEAELKRVKTQLVASQIYQQDSIFSQASQIGRYDALGLPLDTAERFMRRLQSLTGEQLREAARRYLVDDNLTVAILEPEPMGQSRAAPAPRDKDDSDS